MHCFAYFDRLLRGLDNIRVTDISLVLADRLKNLETLELHFVRFAGWCKSASSPIAEKMALEP